MLIFSNVTTHPSDTAALAKARALFISYFSSLYQPQTPNQLGIPCDTLVYLQRIFDGTELALRENPLFHAYVVHDADQLVGFAAGEFIPHHEIILVRTLPVSLSATARELPIRKAMVGHFVGRYPAARAAVIMVRHANQHHINLCLEQGFTLDNSLFETCTYLANSYANDRYNAYVLHLAKD